MGLATLPEYTWGRDERTNNMPPDEGSSVTFTLLPFILLLIFQNVKMLSNVRVLLYFFGNRKRNHLMSNKMYFAKSSYGPELLKPQVFYNCNPKMFDIFQALYYL